MKTEKLAEASNLATQHILWQRARTEHAEFGIKLIYSLTFQ